MNYEEIGFKSGLEIHQQLDGKKLFCSCPTIIKKGVGDFVFTRKLRTSAGESGLVDKAAEHELSKDKIFEYHGFHDVNCLVETDDEPPHQPNKDAINASLMVAKMLNMKIVDVIQFMRKTVIDGSNVSGFQRTALIGYDGFIMVDDKKIRIETLCLEEEAAQVIQRSNNKDSYNISRLGIPLIEIATAPDIKSPEQCKNVASHLGMILRSTSLCKRGIGSIRQDVNISIKGGARTEIKGFQDIKNIPLVVDAEIKRQLSLIKKNLKVEEGVRKAELDGTTTFLRPMPGADRMYPETDIDLIFPSIENIDVPETLKEKTLRYEKKYGLSKDLSSLAIKFESKNNFDFEPLFKFVSVNLTANNIIDILLLKIPDFEKNSSKRLGFDKYQEQIFLALSKGQITLSALPQIFLDVSNNSLDLKKYEQLSETEIKKIAEKIILENQGAPQGLIMGKLMQELKGRADGKKAKDVLEKLLK